MRARTAIAVFEFRLRISECALAAAIAASASCARSRLPARAETPPPSPPAAELVALGRQIFDDPKPLRSAGHQLRELPRSGDRLLEPERLDERAAAREPPGSLRAPDGALAALPALRPELSLSPGGGRSAGAAVRRPVLGRAGRHRSRSGAPAAAQPRRDEQPRRPARRRGDREGALRGGVCPRLPGGARRSRGDAGGGRQGAGGVPDRRRDGAVLVQVRRLHPRARRADRRRKRKGCASSRIRPRGAALGCHVFNETVRDPVASMFTDYGYDAVAIPRNDRAPRPRKPDLGLCERTDQADALGRPGVLPLLSDAVAPQRRGAERRSCTTAPSGACATWSPSTRRAPPIPKRWYRSGVPFDSVPAKYRGRVNVTSPPYNRKRGRAAGARRPRDRRGRGVSPDADRRPLPRDGVR